MSDRQESVLLTALEVSGLLRCSVATVYELVRRGELPGVVRVGRLLRFNRHQMEDHLLGREDMLADTHEDLALNTAEHRENTGGNHRTGP